MTRLELIQRIAAKNPHLLKREVERAIRAIFDAMSDHLAGGGRIELRHFFAFSVRSYGSREGRNPRTGAPLTIPPKRLLHFNPAKKWRSLPRG